jgi:hypothetical protein
MNLKSPHKDWKLDLLAVPDARAVGVDQLLTQLWLRVANDNRPTTTAREPYKRVTELAAKIESIRMSPDFVGFEPGDGVAEAWLRADLLRVFKRSADEFAVARPLHLPATRLRNIAKAGDSGASGIVYTWIEDEDPQLLEEIKDWISVDTSDPGAISREELPSYALALLAKDEEPDKPKPSTPALPRPICRLQGRSFVDDLRRLLAYRGSLPRAVLVDHVGRITALHLGLYLLRTYRAVVELEQTGQSGCNCVAPISTPLSHQVTSRHHKLELVVDCGEDTRSVSARLAQASWVGQEDVLAKYVRSHLTLKKLHELAEGLARKPLSVSTLEDLAAVRDKAPRGRLDEKARDRIASLLESATGEDKQQLRDTRDQYKRLGLQDFDVYMALLFQLSERRWFNYLRFLLDSLFLKNESDGFLRQPLGGRRVRRFALSPGMLETLALISLVQDTERGLETRPIRLDQLIDRLDTRYGMLVARPPVQLQGDPGAVSAMLENQRLLRRRLRESGLFVDLSDAFLAQTLKPRVEVRQ